MARCQSTGYAKNLPTAVEVGSATINKGPISEIELTGTVTSDRFPQGMPVVINVRSDGDTKFTIHTPNRDLEESQVAPGSIAPCFSSINDSREARRQRENCLTAASWVLPTIALAQDGIKKKLFIDLSHTEINGDPLILLQLYTLIPSASNALQKYVQNSSRRTVFLDPHSYLPKSMQFTVRIDDFQGRPTRTIPVEVIYADYRTEQGVTIPFHIQKKIFGHLQFDINIDKATVTK